MKQTIRNACKKRRTALSVEERAVKSMQIVENLLPLLQGKKAIGIYLPLASEVDVTALFMMYNVLGVPKVRNDEDMDFFLLDDITNVEEGMFHILEPNSTIWMDPKDFEAMIVPLVAFDENCHRLGQGKGYYDRYLRQCEHTLVIGVGFECQKVDDVPVDEHDITLDYIVSEHAIYQK